MADISKDTIYVDVDDEITIVIDKVLASDKKVVALVLPKRASVFQSVVNMKLLKLKAESADKHLVLITTESSLLPLAGSVGLYVAKTLASKPTVPHAPDSNESVVEADEDEALSMNEEDEPDLEALAAAPVGALALDADMKDAPEKDVESIELDNTPKEEASEDAKDGTKSKDKSKKHKKDKNLAVPNFNKFRIRLLLGLALIIILIVADILLFHVLPKAVVDIKTDATAQNTSVNFNMTTTSSTLNASTSTVPAKEVTETKTYTATVNTTGQLNNGQSATGTVQMTAQECTYGVYPSNVPAGSEIVQSGLAYITQSNTTWPKNPTSNSNNCYNFTATKTTDIQAQHGGTSYNTGAGTSFSVPGASDISATGSASGGTDDIVQIVSQQDITDAQNKVSVDDTTPKQTLASQLTGDNFTPIQETFNAGTPTATPSATAGTPATSVTVTESVVFTMYGVNYNDLQTLVDGAIKSQLTGNQTIISDGLGSATYTGNGSPTSLTVQTTAVVGQDLSASQLKTQIEGQKVGQVETIIGGDQHVTSVVVKLSPFYVSKVPSNPSKISIVIYKPTSSNAAN